MRYYCLVIKRKLRIAQIAPIAERVPPRKYGGTERVVYNLTEELVRRGHDVTLFATSDSITSARLVSVARKGLRDASIENPYGLNNLTLLNIMTAYKMQDNFDIIHDHNANYGLPSAELSHVPVVLTMHAPLLKSGFKLFKQIKKSHLVMVSQSQADAMPTIKSDVVYNGLSMEKYPFSPRHKGYLLFVGRISMEKGVHVAIEVSKYLDIPLIIAAKLDTVDEGYYKKYIKPHLSDKIKWIGEVDERKRNILMKNALCFVHPVIFSEPFGLTLIESMACGTPVVAMNRGAIPEVVESGKTGFVVKNIDEMISAVVNIKSIDRTYCRKYVLQKFNEKNMADKYESLYRNILLSA